ncbi:MAG: hypothetical protein QXO25_06440 [Candidatus Bathyarchaeia archaeon]
MGNHITVQVVAYKGNPPFNIQVEIRSKLSETRLREFTFLISELGRLYCEKFEYSGAGMEVYPYVRNRSGKDFTLGVGFAYINRSLYVDKAIDLASGGELYLKDSSTYTSSFPQYNYEGFNCGKQVDAGKTPEA